MSFNLIVVSGDDTNTTDVEPHSTTLPRIVPALRARSKSVQISIVTDASGSLKINNVASPVIERTRSTSWSNLKDEKRPNSADGVNKQTDMPPSLHYIPPTPLKWYTTFKSRYEWEIGKDKEKITLDYDKMNFSKNNIKRSEVIHELILTERDYVWDLRIIKDVIIMITLVIYCKY